MNFSIGNWFPTNSTCLPVLAVGCKMYGPALELPWRKSRGQTQRVEVGFEAHKPDAHKTLSANLLSVLPLLPDLHRQSLPQLAVCKE